MALNNISYLIKEIGNFNNLDIDLSGLNLMYLDESGNEKSEKALGNIFNGIEENKKIDEMIINIKK